MFSTFEEKLAYDIGVNLAREEYMEKQANWAAVQQLGRGLKGIATGQGKTMGANFQTAAGAGFKDTMGQIRSGLTDPWKNMYQTYGARRGRDAYGKTKDSLAAATENQKRLKAIKPTVDGVANPNMPTADQLAAAKETVTKATTANKAQIQNIKDGWGNVTSLNRSANKGYIPRHKVDTAAVDTAKANLATAQAATDPNALLLAQRALDNAQRGAVNWGQVGTMGAGAGLAGTGAYMAGNAAFGGGDTYNMQPQVAPHQYYMNQLGNWWNS